MKGRMKTLVLYSGHSGTNKTSYYDDWLDAFLHCKYFDIRCRDIIPPYLRMRVPNPSRYEDPEGMPLSRRVSTYQVFYQSYSWFYRHVMSSLVKRGGMWDMSEVEDQDLIILLHSTNADSMLALSLLETYLKNREGKLLIFVGNEYCLMAEKIRFIQNVEADFVASQLPKTAASWLYGDCPKSKLLFMPHGLNSRLYKPYREQHSRKIDIGFIGDRYSPAIGDIERTELIEYFAGDGFGLDMRVDIRIGKNIRLPRDEYVAFLNAIRAQSAHSPGRTTWKKATGHKRKLSHF